MTNSLKLSDVTYHTWLFIYYVIKQTQIGESCAKFGPLVWEDDILMIYDDILILSLYRAVLASRLLLSQCWQGTRHWKHKAEHFWPFAVCEFHSSRMCSSLSQRWVSLSHSVKFLHKSQAKVVRFQEFSVLKSQVRPLTISKKSEPFTFSQLCVIMLFVPYILKTYFY